MSSQHEADDNDQAAMNKVPINDSDSSIKNLSSSFTRKSSVPSPVTKDSNQADIMEKKRRKPFHHSSMPTYQGGNVQVPIDDTTAATYSRYRYYSRLAPPDNQTLAIPDHVLPSYIFAVNVPFFSEVRDAEGKQNSLVTIFSIWNTMMGTSLLSMPWAIHQAGFAMGIFLLVTMAGLTLYTCYRVVQSVSKHESSGRMVEFSDVCKAHLGKIGEFISVVFSLVALLGAMIVYWVLMSNFLYNTVKFIYDSVTHEMPTNQSHIDPSPVVCVYPENQDASKTDLYQLGGLNNSSVFDEVWSKTHTVPLFLLILIVPLVNFKSPTFFTKFNALGTLSVVFLFSFIIIKFVEFNGIHMDFYDEQSVNYVEFVTPYFPAFSGLLALSYFIHNAVSSIMRGQRHPENNGRDLTIAYLLVAATYAFVGLMFYASFPIYKYCIADNLLENFHSSDVLAFAARLFLLFQMTTLFPLLVYIIRVQLFDQLFDNAYPGLKHVILLNVCLLTVCVLFASFFPKIGTIIRFSGAFCGLAYIFTLPCLIYLSELKQMGQLQWYHVVIHGFIIVLGVLNFLAQFAILLY